MKNKEKGITLISLVVTVIVLIILAGVSINILFNEDGIITKAKQAAENMEIATLQEQERLNELNSYLSGETTEGELVYDKIAELNQKYNTLKEQYDTLNQTLENTTAEASQILSGQTAYSKGNLITGTMPNIGAVTATINAGESYTIPEGYHDGSGYVTVGEATQMAKTGTFDITENGTYNIECGFKPTAVAIFSTNSVRYAYAASIGDLKCSRAFAGGGTTASFSNDFVSPFTSLTFTDTGFSITCSSWEYARNCYYIACKE